MYQSSCEIILSELLSSSNTQLPHVKFTTSYQMTVFVHVPIIMKTKHIFEMLALV